MKVIDGDTIVVRAKIWLGQEIETEVRLNDIDTPELRGKCPGNVSWPSRPAALCARIDGGPVILRDIQYGKFAGRVIGSIETMDGNNLEALLVKHGLGYV